MIFGFLLFNDVEELDFIGPWEIIGMWSKNFGGPDPCLLINQTGETVECAKGLKVLPTNSFVNCPPLDYLLVPGGQGTRKEQYNLELIDFIRKQSAYCRAVLSVCTGSLILQATGLLNGKRATTHWRSLDLLRQTSGVTVVEQRFVRDGDIWTAAGVSAGIDLALALIADQAGEDIAGKVQLAVEYYPGQVRYGKAHLNSLAPAYLRAAQK